LGDKEKIGKRKARFNAEFAEETQRAQRFGEELKIQVLLEGL
jgi:hypothetical protein